MQLWRYLLKRKSIVSTTSEVLTFDIRCVCAHSKTIYSFWPPPRGSILLLLYSTAWCIISFFFPSLFCSLSPARKLPSPKKFRNPKTHTLVSNYLASICNIKINVYIFRNVVHISNPVEIVPILLCILLYKNGKRSLQNDLRACYSHYFVFTEPPFTLYTYRYI